MLSSFSWIVFDGIMWVFTIEGEPLGKKVEVDKYMQKQNGFKSFR